MREYLELGCVPSSEECVQVGSEEYSKRATRECLAYLTQLERMFPELSDKDCTLRIRTFNHDFGSYKEVVVYYDDDNGESIDYAFHVENNLPETWDDAARKELGIESIGQRAMKRIGL